MTDYSIRRRNRLAAEEHDEEEAELYAQLEAEIDDRDRAEHEAQFGPAIPYERNGARIHSEVMARLAVMRDD